MRHADRSAPSRWLLLRRLSGAGEPLHRGERAIDICRRRKAADRRCNNAVRRDDKGRAFRKTVANFDAARVLKAMFLGINIKVIGIRDLAIRVGRNRNLSGAVQRVGGKRVQTVDIVQRHADHRRTRPEGVRLARRGLHAGQNDGRNIARIRQRLNVGCRTCKPACRSRRADTCMRSHTYKRFRKRKTSHSCWWLRSRQLKSNQDFWM